MRVPRTGPCGSATAYAAVGLAMRCARQPMRCAGRGVRMGIQAEQKDKLPAFSLSGAVPASLFQNACHFKYFEMEHAGTSANVAIHERISRFLMGFLFLR
jgi:hypothetical protein